MLVVSRTTHLLYILLAMCLLVLEGCSRFLPTRPEPPLGWTSQNDALAVAVALCPGETVERVAVSSVGPETAAEVEEVLLWEIQSAGTGSSATEYAIGKAPAGFTETMPLQLDLVGAEYLIFVETTAGSYDTILPVAQVDAGRVFDGEERTREDFSAKYAANCPG